MKLTELVKAIKAGSISFSNTMHIIAEQDIKKYALVGISHYTIKAINIDDNTWGWGDRYCFMGVALKKVKKGQMIPVMCLPIQMWRLITSE
jgi:hypothetical protein